MKIEEAMHHCCLVARTQGEVSFGDGFKSTKALSIVLQTLGTLLKHCNPSKPLKINGFYYCPECRHELHLTASVCHKCGKSIDWVGNMR